MRKYLILILLFVSFSRYAWGDFPDQGDLEILATVCNCTVCCPNDTVIAVAQPGDFWIQVRSDRRFLTDSSPPVRLAGETLFVAGLGEGETLRVCFPFTDAMCNSCSGGSEPYVSPVSSDGITYWITGESVAGTCSVSPLGDTCVNIFYSPDSECYFVRVDGSTLNVGAPVHLLEGVYLLYTQRLCGSSSSGSHGEHCLRDSLWITCLLYTSDAADE